MRYDRAKLQAKLKQSAAWRERALRLLFLAQTQEEQVLGETLYHNEEGFGTTDATRLTAIALRQRKGLPLTRSDDITLRYRLPKYWRQLLLAIGQAQAPRVLKQTKSYVELAEPGHPHG